MQFADTVDTEGSEQIAQALLELRARTRALRIETRELEQQVSGASCTTLRLVLAAQVHELGRAEAQLASASVQVGGPHSRTRQPDAPSPIRYRRVDEWLSFLIDSHVAASKVARAAAGTARATHNLVLDDHLIHRANVHDEAELTLASLLLSSTISCEVCPTRRTCAISAVSSDEGFQTATPGPNVVGLTLDFEAVRAELLLEHADLRRRIDEARKAAEAASSGDSSYERLRSLTDALAGALRAHNEHEEELLGEVLPTLDAWGSVRREIMTERHVSEHGELAGALEGLDPSFPRTERGSLIAMLDRILSHMDREEETLLNDPLLREIGSEAEQVSG